MTTKIERQHQLISQLEAMGFTLDESRALRRIEMTLHRWGEQECGDGNDYASWAIERDEQTGKPYMVTYPHQDSKSHRRRIADRETGALRRLAKIVAGRNARSTDPVIAYHQTDPRGAALYIVRESDLDGLPVDQVYTRGLCVAA